MLIDEKGVYSSVLWTQTVLQTVLPPDDAARRVPPKLLPSKLRMFLVQRHFSLSLNGGLSE